MIISRLSSGLANQMYEYAAAYALSKKMGRELILDISECFDRPCGYLLDAFNIPNHKKIMHYPYQVDYFSHENVEIVPEFERNNALILVEDYMLNAYIERGKYARCEEVSDGIYRVEIGKENFFYLKAYAGICESLAISRYDNIIIQGYFFDKEKYFGEYWEEIRELFSLKEESREVSAFKKDSFGRTTIGVHIRRGDMLFASWADSMSDNYYKAAISYYRNKYNNPLFYVISDDIEYAKKLLGNDSNYRYLHFCGYDDADLYEFVCLSMCDHHILSNSSTYSRLAHELSRNPSKTFSCQNKRKMGPLHRVMRVIKKLKGVEENGVVGFTEYDINRWGKKYSIDNSGATYTENLDTLEEIANSSINTFKWDLETTKQVMRRKLEQSITLKEFIPAIQISDILIDELVSDNQYRKMLIKLYRELALFEEAKILETYQMRQEICVILTDKPYCASSIMYYPIAVGLCLNRMGYEVLFLFKHIDDTEDVYIHNNEYYTNRHGIKSGCKQYLLEDVLKGCDLESNEGLCYLSQFFTEIVSLQGKKVRIITDIDSVYELREAEYNLDSKIVFEKLEHRIEEDDSFPFFEVEEEFTFDKLHRPSLWSIQKALCYEKKWRREV